jgi:hypothetical protein
MDATLGAPLAATQPRSALRTGALAVPALASLGAGAIHAAAMGVHNEHDQAVIAFAIVAAFQLGWGVVAFVSNRVPVAIVGAIGNAAIVAGWVMAKTSGIGFVEGLEESEAVQWADGAAAALAAFSVLAVLFWLVHRTNLLTNPITLRAAIVPFAIVSISGMVSAANGHVHGEGGHGHGGGSESNVAGASHQHDDATNADGHANHTDTTQAVAKPFDPSQPIDLGGLDGVTPAQQAEAENLLAATLVDLPRWSDPAYADAQGWHSIQDSVTGYEHFINRPLMEDGRVLDPDYPESLVYQVDRETGKKELVAAMFMAEPGTALDNVPTLGGKLLQWHIHNNLCFSPEAKPRVAGLTNADGTCRAPLVKGPEVPMVHVWITSHPCGPFAALEGIAGGQIKAGEERWCDTAHGHSH